MARNVPLRKKPYLPLYVQDYMTDEKLNMCSAASQGVYVKIMCVLHKCDPYGVLKLKDKFSKNGSLLKGYSFQLSHMISFPPKIIEKALVELISEDVLSIDDEVLFQKRMVKDGKISEERAKAGAKPQQN